MVSFCLRAEVLMIEHRSPLLLTHSFYSWSVRIKGPTIVLHRDDHCCFLVFTSDHISSFSESFSSDIEIAVYP